ncbi:MAG: hypothetical protein HOC91_11155 [Nitrospinaceae bacterium]|nr:hypothetical protein [Nitrospinaceae bacterium]MBT3821291.1 hypothetical protein [Nitrospinaceae bacterium]MBT4092635.1 hypothetical protein [Nitrospinaceae bacterium]MBT4431063.1 hypothetical protein [Nitrospinaceae bacterium]MBT5367008.1 hypothetical protein [Nitrospinaceae bacterium]
MVDVVEKEELLKKTMGGVPVKKGMFVYNGIPYECGCGETHKFSESQTRIFCELGARNFVFLCLDEYLTLVKVKGFVTHKFKSVLSAKN